MVSLDNQIIDYDHLYLNLTYETQYVPSNFAFSESYQVLVSRNVSASDFDIWIGPTGPTRVFSSTTIEPNEIAIRDYNTTHAKIYYSRNKTDGGFELVIEVVNTLYTTHENITYDLGNDNCGDIIEVNNQIIVVACSTAENNHGMLSVYRESDMDLYTEIRGNSSFAGICKDVVLISSQYYHQVYFNSFNSSILEYGQLSRVEILIDRNNSSKNQTFLEREFYSNNSNYFRYTKHFDKDSQNKLYISNMKDDGEIENIIDLMQVCTYDQYFDNSSNSCISVEPGEITFTAQQITPDNCTAYNDTNYKNRIIAESVCNFGCGVYQFGKNCESCSAYMARVGEVAPMYKRFSDSDPTYCGLVEDTRNCSRYSSYCSKCEFTNG